MKENLRAIAGEVNDNLSTASNLISTTTFLKGDNMDTASKITIVPGKGVTMSTTDEKVQPKPTTVPSFGLPPDMIGQNSATGGDNRALFDPEKLRVSQDFIEDAGVETVQGAIGVHKPGKQEYVRVHPEIRLLVAVIENSEDRELSIVVPELVGSVNDEVSFVQLCLAVNRYGVSFIWPLKISRDGKRNAWNDSAMNAAEKAIIHWVRMKSGQGQYVISVAQVDYGEPEWPDMSFQEILEQAFKGRIITDYNHPLLKKLRGEI